MSLPIISGNYLLVPSTRDRRWHRHGGITRFSSSCQCQRDGTRISLPCPAVVISYNTYMGGVDRGDQLTGYYSCRSKSGNFYKYIFYFLLDTAVINAYILHTRYTESPTFRHVKDFRVTLAKSLIEDYCSRRRPGRGDSSLLSFILPSR